MCNHAITLNPDTIIYKYFPLKWLRVFLSEHKMSFNTISAWKKTDKFEDIFLGCNLRNPNFICALPVSTFCDRLYGQSWTLEADKLHMWEQYSTIDNTLENVSVMLKTRVSDMERVMGCYIKGDAGYIMFPDTKVAAVDYKNEDEIIEWISSIETIRPEEIQRLAVQAAFLKRKKNREGYNYETENEIRCVTSDNSGKERLTFNDVSPNIISEYTLDPRLTGSQIKKIREQLIQLGVKPKDIHTSSIAE